MVTDFTKCSIGFASGNAFDNLTTALSFFGNLLDSMWLRTSLRRVRLPQRRTIGKECRGYARGISVAKAYSIGELIEMLPKYTDDSDILHIEAYDSIGWEVWYGCYCNGDEVLVEYSTENKELIDALYDMIVKLKNEGVI